MQARGGKTFEAPTVTTRVSQDKNAPKRHHFLPRSYLKGFTRDEMLWVFDRKLNKYREQHPLRTAAIHELYTFEKEDGERSLEVEHHLAAVEGKATPVLAALERGESLMAEQRVDLAYFLGLLHSRVPKFEKEISDIADQTTKALLKRMFPNEAAVVARLRERGEEREIDPANILNGIQNERFSVKSHRNNTLSMMLDHAREKVKLFCAMDWMVLHADPRTSFITTDAPFALIASEELNRSGKPVLGVASFEIVKAVPLTKRVCLLMGGAGSRFGHVETNRDGVRDLNLRLARESDRFVIAGDEPHLRSIVKATRVDRERTGTRMRVDHVQHPTEPNRTFMITRRVAVDAPDEPLKIVVEQSAVDGGSERNGVE